MFLSVHLSIGVFKHCIPHAQRDRHLLNHLRGTTSHSPSPFSRADSEEPSEGDGSRGAGNVRIEDAFGELSIGAGGKAESQMDALDKAREFSAKGMEGGEGRLAFESYLAMALGRLDYELQSSSIRVA